MERSLANCIATQISQQASVFGNIEEREFGSSVLCECHGTHFHIVVVQCDYVAIGLLQRNTKETIMLKFNHMDPVNDPEDWIKKAVNWVNSH